MAAYRIALKNDIGKFVYVTLACKKERKTQKLWKGPH